MNDIYQFKQTHYLYNTWMLIVRRCYDEKCKAYEKYGKSGIGMYQAWKDDSRNFYRWIDENLGTRPNGYSLDRIDPFGNYEPGNLRWADRRTQALNIRNPDQFREKMRSLAMKRVVDKSHNFIGVNEKRIQEGTHNFITRPPSKGTIWITDGKGNKRIPKDSMIPEGFRKGMTR